MSKESIIEKIIGDAHKKASDIIALAEQKAKAVADTANEEAQAYKTAELKKAEDFAILSIQRRISVAELEVKKILLKAKQDVLEKVFEDVFSTIKEMPNEEYLLLIKGMLEYAEDGDEVIISELDKKRITSSFIKKIADERGISLTLSKEYGDFQKGLILSNRQCNKNMSLELELASLRENREAKIAKMIFEEK